MAKLNKQELLAALRKKAGDISLNTGNGGFWKIPAPGDYRIRVLPPTGSAPFFFQEVGRHWNLPGRKTEFCPEITTEGEHECPLCAASEVLMQSTNPDYAKMGAEIKANKQYWMVIVVRDLNDSEAETAEGPFIFTPGPMIFGAIQALILNPEYGDIADIDEGFDLVINRVGTKREDTEYRTTASRYQRPLHADPDTADKLMEKATDLGLAFLSDNPDEDQAIRAGRILGIKSWDRLIKEYPMLFPDEAKTEAPVKSVPAGTVEPVEDPFPAAEVEASVEEVEAPVEELPAAAPEEQPDPEASGRRRRRRRVAAE